MKLSVLVPVYNSEKFLKDSLKSIQCFSNKDIEIICINDGSIDSSLSIINEFCVKDDRFVLLNKKNTGYGDSLNQALKIATGEYIAFLESDDTVVASVLERILRIAEDEKLDVIKGNYNLFYEDRSDYYQNNKGVEYNKVFAPKQKTAVFLSAPSIWSGVYRHDFLIENAISFLDTPGASYQDTSFMFKVWAMAKRAMLIDEAVINYRQDNPESSSNSRNKKIFDIFNEVAEMKSFLKRNNLNELLSICMRTKWQSFAWTLNRLYNQNDKIIFLLKVHEDVLIDFYEGNLLRQYWDDSNWNIVFNIIAFFYKIIIDIDNSFETQNIVESIIKNGLGEKIQCINLSFEYTKLNADVLYIINSKEPLYETIVGKFVSDKKMNYLVI